MRTEDFVLAGKYVRLEPLEHGHVDGLVGASTRDASLYRWSPVPRNKSETIKYVDTALAWGRRNSGAFRHPAPTGLCGYRLNPLLEVGTMGVAASTSTACAGNAGRVRDRIHLVLIFSHSHRREH